MNRAEPPVVLKFGGTSVSSAERWRTITRIVSGHLSPGDRVVLVQSAIRGVTDILEAMVRQARERDIQPLVVIEGFSEKLKAR
jgi:diaminopimelate decarboxylase/aspartate kinase